MAKYLRYVLKNIEPIRIADDSTSQNGQTNSLKYIPGTTIRGLVISRLASEDDFEEIKETLFSNKVRYMNAYLRTKEHVLIPSPKGFYEDKKMVEGKKDISNVVIDGAFSEGYKRATLGKYSRIDGNCIYYYDVRSGSDMKIKINLKGTEKQNVFRNEFIAPEQLFEGYIAIEDDSILERIKGIFADTIIIGNARSAGLGKCIVEECKEITEIPYQKEGFSQENHCYMMLLSATTMRDEKGEYCGINTEQLADRLGVENLEIKFCSTSMVSVRGYNRTLGIKTPSVAMYEQGSVFHLTFNGTITAEKMEEVCHTGIGVRRNEGFGRILFLKDYEQIHYKQAGKVSKGELVVDAKASDEDMETLKIAAKGYYINELKDAIKMYVVNHPIKKGTVANSQLGKISSITSRYKYAPEEGIKKLEEYLGHALDKEQKNKVHNQRNSILSLKGTVEEIFQTKIEEMLNEYLSDKVKASDQIMGIDKNSFFTKNDEIKYQFKLLNALIRYDNKEGN